MIQKKLEFIFPYVVNLGVGHNVDYRVDCINLPPLM